MLSTGKPICHIDFRVYEFMNLFLQHTVIAVLVILEIYMVHHKFLSKKSGICVTIGFGIVYQIWLVHAYLHINIV